MKCELVQHLADVVHAAVDDLQRADAVVGVAHALHQLGGIAAELVGDRQAGRVVTRRVDAEARGQSLNGLALKVAVDAQVLLRDERVYVGLNRKCHREILS